MAPSNKILICSAAAFAFISVVSAAPFPDDLSSIDETARNEEVAYRLQMAINAAKEIEFGPLQKAVQTNFLKSLYNLANASAVVGANVSKAADTTIMGFVQDIFNLRFIGPYLPRLIFLDGPSQFYEVLRLARLDQIKLPTAVDSAMDTLTKFAIEVRDASTTTNVSNPLSAYFPNIFKGSEKLAGDVLFGVFSWLAPVNPTDMSMLSHEGLQMGGMRPL